MLLLPPRSTLFPYTTLFRSTGDLGLEGRVRLQAAQHRLVGLVELGDELGGDHAASPRCRRSGSSWVSVSLRSEEHTSELQSLRHLVCRLLLEKKKQQ